MIYWISGLLDCWDLQATAPGGSLRCSVDSKVAEWRSFAASFQMISCQRPATRRKKRRWKRHRLPGDGLLEISSHWKARNIETMISNSDRLSRLIGEST